MAGITLDAGALIAVDRGHREVLALVARVAERGEVVHIPAGALAQAMRNPKRQARLSRLVRQPSTNVVALDRVDAVRVGRSLAVSGTSDVVDAHVVECARRFSSTIATSDQDDLRALDASVRLIEV